MPDHRRRFVERVPAPVYADNAQYRAVRHETYQTDTHGFPTQRARDDQRAIDDCRSRGDAVRTSYFSERDRAKADVASLPSEEEQRYYVPYVNITPRDHRRLIDPARDYYESELDIAEKRENLYVRTPLAYDTLENQTRHYGHIQNHYGQADTADRFLVQHLRHADDPTSEARDLYGREVPANARESSFPYPARRPPGTYATVHGRTVPCEVIAPRGRGGRRS